VTVVKVSFEHLFGQLAALTLNFGAKQLGNDQPIERMRWANSDLNQRIKIPRGQCTCLDIVTRTQCTS
jgi:hypothetical protein